MPGFVDIHTHYDAQLHFEPTASPASWHGVTTVLMGNCGFSIAPAKPADVSWLLEMLSRVEGMSAPALQQGVTFEGGSFADFLAGFDGRIAVNAAGFVGHSAVRRYVRDAGDLLETLPFRFDDFTQVQALSLLAPGDDATVLVTVEGVSERPTSRPRFAAARA